MSKYGACLHLSSKLLPTKLQCLILTASLQPVPGRRGFGCPNFPFQPRKMHFVPAHTLSLSNLISVCVAFVFSPRSNPSRSPHFFSCTIPETPSRIQSQLHLFILSDIQRDSPSQTMTGVSVYLDRKCRSPVWPSSFLITTVTTT